MKIILYSRQAVKFAVRVAAQFIAEVEDQTDIEALYQMAKTPYFQDLHRRVAGEEVEFYNQNRGDLTLNTDLGLFWGIHKVGCQQAFADKLVELAVTDRDILLATISLRNAWHSEGRKGCWYLPDREISDPLSFLAVDTIKYLGPLAFPFMGKSEWSPDDVFYTEGGRWREYDGDKNPVHNQSLLQVKAAYEFGLAIGRPVAFSTMTRLAEKVLSFQACKLLYMSAHTSTVGEILLRKACDLATTSSELMLVSQWLFQATRSEVQPLKSRLVSVLKRLTSSLE